MSNTPTQAESLLYRLEQAAGGTSLHINADKRDFMCFNQRGNNVSVSIDTLMLMLELGEFIGDIGEFIGEFIGEICSSAVFDSHLLYLFIHFGS